MKFRFEDFEIWKMAIEIADLLFDIAEKLEEERYFRWAEQLRSAGMSMSNNIAEDAGSDYNPEFKKFLSYARRSCFECANIVILLNRRNLVAEIEMLVLKDKLDHLSRKITKFKKRI